MMSIFCYVDLQGPVEVRVPIRLYSRIIQGACQMQILGLYH